MSIILQNTRVMRTRAIPASQEALKHNWRISVTSVKYLTKTTSINGSRALSCH